MNWKLILAVVWVLTVAPPCMSAETAPMSQADMDQRTALSSALQTAFLEHQGNKAELASALQNVMREQGINPNTNATSRAAPFNFTPADIEKLFENLEGVRKLFKLAETAFADGRFCEAGRLYKSVSLATVKGSEDMSASARDRLIDIEKIAQERLVLARDADFKADYATELRELSYLDKELSETNAGKEAARLRIILRSKPAGAAFIDLDDANRLETDRKFSEALAHYLAIASNPRYADTIAAIQAGKKAAKLQQDLPRLEASNTESAAKSEAKASALLLSAQNLLANKLRPEAMEKLRQLVESYPDSRSAIEAKKLLNSIK